jgi:hypothetical protein
MKKYNFDQKVEIIKKSAKFLCSMTYPKCKIGDDSDLVILKTTEVVVDGYDSGIFFSISDFGDYKIKVLQIWPLYYYFIPFNVISKIAKKFLGDQGLSFFEIWSNDRMLYCWTLVLDKEDQVINDFYRVNQKENFFSDFRYYSMEPGEINII